jgi:hypothetical protein
MRTYKSKQNSEGVVLYIWSDTEDEAKKGLEAEGFEFDCATEDPEQFLDICVEEVFRRQSMRRSC